MRTGRHLRALLAVLALTPTVAMGQATSVRRPAAPSAVTGIPATLTDPEGRSSKTLTLRRHERVTGPAGERLHVVLHAAPCTQHCEYADMLDPAVLSVWVERLPGPAERIYQSRFGCSEYASCDNSTWLTDVKVATLGGRPALLLTTFWQAGGNNIGFSHPVLAYDACAINPVELGSANNGAIARAQGIEAVFKADDVGDPTLSANGLVQEYLVYRGGRDMDANCCPTGGTVRVTYQLRTTGGRWWLLPVQYDQKTPPERRSP